LSLGVGAVFGYELVLVYESFAATCVKKLNAA